MQEKAQEELYNRVRSFGYAFEGWWYVLKTQHNAWIHGVASVLVFGFAFWLQITLRDWAVLILAMMAVWMGEFMNTAVEAVVDMAMPEKTPTCQSGEGRCRRRCPCGCPGCRSNRLFDFGAAAVGEVDGVNGKLLALNQLQPPKNNHANQHGPNYIFTEISHPDGDESRDHAVIA